MVHTASPVEFDPDSFEEKHLKPAVQGTRGVLEAAAREVSVKSVVMTSTYGASHEPAWRNGRICLSMVADGRRNWRPSPTPDGAGRAGPERGGLESVHQGGAHQDERRERGRVSGFPSSQPLHTSSFTRHRDLSLVMSPSNLHDLHALFLRKQVSPRSMLTASEAFPAGFLYYKGGKKYAELAAWDVQKESGNKWPLATMNCVMIWGPSSRFLSIRFQTLCEAGTDSSPTAYKPVQGRNVDRVPVRHAWRRGGGDR